MTNSNEGLPLAQRFAVLKTITLLSDSIASFTNKCLIGLKVNKKKIESIGFVYKAIGKS